MSIITYNTGGFLIIFNRYHQLKRRKLIENSKTSVNIWRSDAINFELEKLERSILMNEFRISMNVFSQFRHFSSFNFCIVFDAIFTSSFIDLFSHFQMKLNLNIKNCARDWHEIGYKMQRFSSFCIKFLRIFIRYGLILYHVKDFKKYIIQIQTKLNKFCQEI